MVPIRGTLVAPNRLCQNFDRHEPFKRCMSLGVYFARANMNKSVFQPAGNYYDKYGTANPIARRLMAGFLTAFDASANEAGPPSRALEIGCGEGELSIRLARAGWQVDGCDIAPEAIVEARRRATAGGVIVPFSVESIQSAVRRFEPVPLVVCCEVLEHLEDANEALSALAALSTQYVLVSVPREPIWRALNMARLKYLADLGNTPGHVQHWSRRGFLSHLRSRFDVINVRTPLPWTMALCRVRR